MSQPNAEPGTTQEPINQRGHIEHQIGVTGELITSYEGEIQQLEETIESRDGTIQQLRGEIVELKERIENIPIAPLTERNNILESELRLKTDEIKRLNDRLQIVLSKDGASTGRIEQLTEANKMLERQRIIQVQAIQKLQDTMEYQKKEVDKLNTRLNKNDETIEQQSTEMENLESKCKSLEEENAKKTEQTSLTKAELEKTIDERTLYFHRMNELMKYEEKCGVQEQKVQLLTTNILPEKERTISALMIRVTELEDRLEVLVRDTIPRSEHLDILNTEVERIDCLRETCREEYKAQIDILEDKNEILEKRLEDTERDVESMEDKKVALFTAEGVYKRTAKENVELTNKNKELMLTINRLREKVSYLEGIGHSSSGT
ncbi:hypothetical protein ACF0H5_008269 [Mactra antiquata]